MPNDWIDALALSIEYVLIAIGLASIFIGLVLAFVDLSCTAYLVMFGLLVILFAFIDFHPRANSGGRAQGPTPSPAKAAPYYSSSTAYPSYHAPPPTPPARRCTCGFVNPSNVEFC